jgi:choline dehydrogenase
VDYVVVGAGSAGAVLAGRLTEDPATEVLLVEAGLDYRSADTVEALRSTAMSPSLDIDNLRDYYWVNLTARRNIHQSFEFYWQGKGVGGSSAINGQVAFRPPPDDFDEWEKAGCVGWGWDDVLPYFIRLEDDEMFGDEPHHGRGGPVPIVREPVENWSALDLAFRDIVLDRGFAWEPDTNAPGSSGCGYYPYNSRDGVRVSTNDAYLEPARDRPNLTIRPHVVADRILFEGERAIGVHLVGPDGPEDVFADTVILSGGTVGSASVLLRSGIGSPEHLQELGIDVLVDLPVGAAVQDHANVNLRFDLNPALAQGAYRPVCCARYTTGLGGGGRNDAFVGACGPFGLEVQMGGATAWLNQPFSLGSLRLLSPDPLTDAVVDINLLGDERDRVRMRHLLATLCELVHHPRLSRVLAGTARARDGTTLPEIERMSEPEVDLWTQRVVRDVAHLVGSCRMGAGDDPSAVVDPDCSVLGVEGLRVIDASVFPAIPRANTNLAVIMLAERMADVLRAGASVGGAEV